MRIVKSCSAAPKPLPPRELTMSDVQVGDIFRFSDHRYGPYLRVQNNHVVDLSSGGLIPVTEHGSYRNIKILDKAFLVTGEE